MTTYAPAPQAPAYDFAGEAAAMTAELRRGTTVITGGQSSIGAGKSYYQAPTTPALYAPAAPARSSFLDFLFAPSDPNAFARGYQQAQYGAMQDPSRSYVAPPSDVTSSIESAWRDAMSKVGSSGDVAQFKAASTSLPNVPIDYGADYASAPAAAASSAASLKMALLAAAVVGAIYLKKKMGKKP